MKLSIALLAATFLCVAVVGCPGDSESKNLDQQRDIEVDKTETFIEERADDMIVAELIHTSVDVSLISIILKHEDKNVVFECIADKGYFFEHLTHKNLGEELSVVSGRIQWRPTDLVVDGMGRELEVEQAFVDVIVKLDDTIIGYAVIEMLQTSIFHTPTVLKSVLFPKVGGEYQKVTEEQVKAAIEQVKQEQRESKENL